ncbi:MAG: hypothetical protein P9M01_01735 [Candidatus Kappaea frigidicola]|nr:hypothetical protein [Candidatus Kappaea frigidicola]
MKKLRKGQILISMMVILAGTVAFATFAMGKYIGDMATFYGRQIKYTKGIYYAESGIQRAIYLIKEKDDELKDVDLIYDGDTGTYYWSDSITVNGIAVNIKVYEPVQPDIYSVVSEAQTGVTKPDITAQIKRRQYSQVKVETVGEEERLVFIRYKSAKILTIDY